MANATRSYARKLTLLFRGLEARSGSIDGTAQALVCFRRSGVAIGGERDSPAALSAAAAAWGRVALWLPGIGLRGGAAATAQHGRTSHVHSRCSVERFTFDVEFSCAPVPCPVLCEGALL